MREVTYFVDRREGGYWVLESEETRALLHLASSFYDLAEGDAVSVFLSETGRVQRVEKQPELTEKRRRENEEKLRGLFDPKQ